MGAVVSMDLGVISRVRLINSSDSNDINIIFAERESNIVGMSTY